MSDHRNREAPAEGHAHVGDAPVLQQAFDPNDKQLSTLQSQLALSVAELKAAHELIAAQDRKIAALEEELRKRDNPVATVVKLPLQDRDVLEDIDQDAKRPIATSPSKQVVAMGLALESLDYNGKRYRVLRSPTSIGRAPNNDIPIDAHSVSRYHARIVVDQKGVRLIDLQSTNGCSINGRPVSHEAYLSDGDAIAIGKCNFRFSVGVTWGDIEEWAMDETQVLLDDAAILSRAPKSKSHSAQ